MKELEIETDDLEIKVGVDIIYPQPGCTYVTISEEDFDLVFEHSIKSCGLNILSLFKDLEDKINEAIDEDYWVPVFRFRCENESQFLKIMKQINFTNLQIVSDPEKTLHKTVDASGSENVFVDQKALSDNWKAYKKFEDKFSLALACLEEGINHHLSKDEQSVRFFLRALDKLQLRETIKKIGFYNFDIVSEEAIEGFCPDLPFE